MSQPRFDVIAIGNAIVDVMAPAEDALVERLEMAKGGMMLIDTPRAHALYDAMGPAREISGDLYDFFEHSDSHFAIAFGDSSGKGAAAAHAPTARCWM